MTTDRVDFVPMRLFDNFPKRVFADDLALAEFKQVDPTRFDTRAGRGSACHRPFGNGQVAADPVTVIPIVYIRQPLKAGGEPTAYFRLAHEARTAWGAPRGR
jgi:hypothetical protein